MSRWYARNGDEITQEQAAGLALDHKYRVVQEDHVGRYWVSTVWMLGIDLSRGWDKRPLLFETLIHAADPDDGWLDSELETHWFHTEEEALAWHKETVAKLWTTVPRGRRLAG